ncbi:MAG: CpaF family protein [Coriobacteriaceae bacterium]|nr:CpaF family protein [Coriobacteriaceae bacterium]
MSVLERVRAQGPVPDALGAEELVKQRRWLKQTLIERLGLKAVAEGLTSGSTERIRMELEVACRSILNVQGERVLPEHHDLLVRQVLDEVCGLGPIQPLMDDEEVTEVMINSPEALFFERAGRIEASSYAFDSEEQVMTVLDRILAPLGRRLDKGSPLVNARLANGDRVNAVVPPVAPGGPAVTIRKFSGRITSLERLVELGALPIWYAQLLSCAVRCRQSIAVAGGTGSGKTTLLNALSCEIDHGERIVTIEDSCELRFDTHPNVVALEARDASIEGTGEVTIRELVKNALRMRPDRIIVGEVRGEETIDMLNAMNTGHPGSLTTLHAGDAREAVSRLILMARFGMNLPSELIEEQISTALDLIVMSCRLPDGGRRIGSMAEVQRSDQGRVELSTCVSYDSAMDSWNLLRMPGFIGMAKELGLVDEGEVASWSSLIL